jgi:alpha-L-fucosidase 2
VPADWEHLSFRHLRAEGAFLVSAEMHAHKPDSITVLAEVGGPLKLQLPPGNWLLMKKRSHEGVSGLVQLETFKGERLTFSLLE